MTVQLALLLLYSALLAALGIRLGRRVSGTREFFVAGRSLGPGLIFYGRFLNPGADDRTMLAVTRVAAIASGLVGIALAIVSPTVIDALSIFYALLGVSLFVPILRRPRRLARGGAGSAGVDWLRRRGDAVGAIGDRRARHRSRHAADSRPGRGAHRIPHRLSLRTPMDGAGRNRLRIF